jgi:manganese/iron transport system permease protein
VAGEGSIVVAWLDLIVQPLQYEFMVRGLFASLLVGLVCGVVGCFVVLRGMAFFGDAMSHSVLPGIAVGYLVGGGARGPLFVWAMGTAIVVAFCIGAVAQSGRLKEDTSIGIIFAGMFALGVALISLNRRYSMDLIHFLFGDVLGVAWTDLGITAGLGLLVLACLLLFYKEFLVMSFDETLARTLRLPTSVLYYGLLILIAITIVSSVQTVGVALMLAMLITPPATAYLVTRRLPTMMIVSTLVGSLSGIIGLYVSYYAHIASGAAIVLVCTAIFLLTLLVVRLREKWARPLPSNEA